MTSACLWPHFRQECAHSWGRGPPHCFVQRESCVDTGVFGLHLTAPLGHQAAVWLARIAMTPTEEQRKKINALYKIH